MQWTSGIDGVEYAAFINRLFDKITIQKQVMDADGNFVMIAYVWKDEADVVFDEVYGVEEDVVEEADEVVPQAKVERAAVSKPSGGASKGATRTTPTSAPPTAAPNTPTPTSEPAAAAAASPAPVAEKEVVRKSGVKKEKKERVKKERGDGGQAKASSSSDQGGGADVIEPEEALESDEEQVADEEPIADRAVAKPSNSPNYRSKAKAVVKNEGKKSKAATKVQAKLREKHAKEELTIRKEAAATITKIARKKQQQKEPSRVSTPHANATRPTTRERHREMPQSAGQRGNIQFWALRKGLPERLLDEFDGLSEEDLEAISYLSEERRIKYLEIKRNKTIVRVQSQPFQQSVSGFKRSLTRRLARTAGNGPLSLDGTSGSDAHGRLADENGSALTAGDAARRHNEDSQRNPSFGSATHDSSNPSVGIGGATLEYNTSMCCIVPECSTAGSGCSMPGYGTACSSGIMPDYGINAGRGSDSSNGGGSGGKCDNYNTSGLLPPPDRSNQPDHNSQKDGWLQLPPPPLSVHLRQNTPRAPPQSPEQWSLLSGLDGGANYDEDIGSRGAGYQVGGRTLPRLDHNLIVLGTRSPRFSPPPSPRQSKRLSRSPRVADPDGTYGMASTLRGGVAPELEPRPSSSMMRQKRLRPVTVENLMACSQQSGLDEPGAYQASEIVEEELLDGTTVVSWGHNDMFASR